MKIIGVCFLSLISIMSAGQNPDRLLLKNFRPKSIYKIPVTKIEKAKFGIIDVHSHAYAKTEVEIAEWVKRMDRVGIKKTIILTGVSGKKFDELYKLYSKFGNRFDLWCGLDYSAIGDADWSQKAVKEIERCYKMGAKGIGEIHDKGMGLASKFDPKGEHIIHFDDPRMKPVFEKCAELSLPINIHVAEPGWMYEKMDSTNDGLMNAYTWKIDLTIRGILKHDQLVETLENAVRDNPKNTFIACHFANCCYNLSILGALFDKYPNLYADISARYGETAPIPRYMQAFYIKYADRLLYGTDLGNAESMYQVTFRILESNDEHFYETELFGYHSACNGFALPDNVLQKLYYQNAAKILNSE